MTNPCVGPKTCTPNWFLTTMYLKNIPIRSPAQVTASAIAATRKVLTRPFRSTLGSTAAFSAPHVASAAVVRPFGRRGAANWPVRDPPTVRPHGVAWPIGQTPRGQVAKPLAAKWPELGDDRDRI